MDFDLKLLGSIIAGITLQGGILIAAAKTIFATKVEHQQLNKQIQDVGKDLNHKLYDTHGIPIYTQKTECAKTVQAITRQNETLEDNLYSQIARVLELIEKIRTAQEVMNISISRIQVERDK